MGENLQAAAEALRRMEEHDLQEYLRESERQDRLRRRPPVAPEAYLQGYRHALQEVVRRLDTESGALRLEFRAGGVDLGYINGIEHASDVAHAMLEEDW